MSKSLITGGAIVAVCAVLGYTAFSFATKSDAPETSSAGSTPAGVQVADSSGEIVPIVWINDVPALRSVPQIDL